MADDIEELTDTVASVSSIVPDASVDTTTQHSVCSTRSDRQQLIDSKLKRLVVKYSTAFYANRNHVAFFRWAYVNKASLCTQLIADNNTLQESNQALETKVTKLKQLLSRSKQAQARKEEDINNTIQAHVDATEEMKVELQRQFDRDRHQLEQEMHKQHLERSFACDSELLVQTTAERLYSAQQMENLATIEQLRKELQKEQQDHANLRSQLSEASLSQDSQRDMISVYQMQLAEQEALRRTAEQQLTALQKCMARQATELKNATLERQELEYELQQVSTGKLAHSIDMVEHDRCANENRSLTAQVMRLTVELEKESCSRTELQTKYDALEKEEQSVSHLYTLQSADAQALMERVQSQGDEILALKKFIFDNRVSARGGGKQRVKTAPITVATVEAASIESERMEDGERGSGLGSGLGAGSSTDNLLATFSDRLASVLAPPTLQLSGSMATKLVADVRALSSLVGDLVKLEEQLSQYYHCSVLDTVREIQVSREVATAQAREMTRQCQQYQAREKEQQQLLQQRRRQHENPLQQQRMQAKAILAFFINWYKKNVLCGTDASASASGLFPPPSSSAALATNGEIKIKVNNNAMENGVALTTKPTSATATTSTTTTITAMTVDVDAVADHTTVVSLYPGQQLLSSLPDNDDGVPTITSITDIDADSKKSNRVIYSSKLVRSYAANAAELKRVAAHLETLRCRRHEAQEQQLRAAAIKLEEEARVKTDRQAVREREKAQAQAISDLAASALAAGLQLKSENSSSVIAAGQDIRVPLIFPVPPTLTSTQYNSKIRYCLEWFVYGSLDPSCVAVSIIVHGSDSDSDREIHVESFSSGNDSGDSHKQEEGLEHIKGALDLRLLARSSAKGGWDVTELATAYLRNGSAPEAAGAAANDRNTTHRHGRARARAPPELRILNTAMWSSMTVAYRVVVTLLPIPTASVPVAATQHDATGTGDSSNNNNSNRNRLVSVSCDGYDSPGSSDHNNSNSNSNSNSNYVSVTNSITATPERRLRMHDGCDASCIRQTGHGGDGIDDSDSSDADIRVLEQRLVELEHRREQLEELADAGLRLYQQAVDVLLTSTSTAWQEEDDDVEQGSLVDSGITAATLTSTSMTSAGGGAAVTECPEVVAEFSRRRTESSLLLQQVHAYAQALNGQMLSVMQMDTFATANVVDGEDPRAMLAASAAAPEKTRYHASAYNTGGVSSLLAVTQSHLLRSKSKNKARTPRQVTASVSSPESSGHQQASSPALSPTSISASESKSLSNRSSGSTYRIFQCASGHTSTAARTETKIMLPLPQTTAATSFNQFTQQQHQVVLVWKFIVKQPESEPEEEEGAADISSSASSSSSQRQRQQQDIGFTVLHKLPTRQSYSEIIPYVRHHRSDFRLLRGAACAGAGATATAGGRIVASSSSSSSLSSPLPPPMPIVSDLRQCPVTDDDYDTNTNNAAVVAAAVGGGGAPTAVPLTAIRQVELDTLREVHRVEHIPRHCQPKPNFKSKSKVASSGSSSSSHSSSSNSALQQQSVSSESSTQSSLPYSPSCLYCCAVLPPSMTTSTAVSTGPASALVVFDNKYSWLRSKDLEYCIMVLVRDGDDSSDSPGPSGDHAQEHQLLPAPAEDEGQQQQQQQKKVQRYPEAVGVPGPNPNPDAAASTQAQQQHAVTTVADPICCDNPLTSPSSTKQQGNDNGGGGDDQQQLSVLLLLVDNILNFLASHKYELQQ